METLINFLKNHVVLITIVFLFLFAYSLYVFLLFRIFKIEDELKQAKREKTGSAITQNY